jgi:hypothetical protein
VIKAKARSRQEDRRHRRGQKIANKTKGDQQGNMAEQT